MKNLLLMSDSYKYSHYLQMPENTTSMFSYIESRGGRWNNTVFFGLQYFIKEYLTKPFTREDVIEARDFMLLHGEPFNHEGWMGIIEKHNGFLPIKIKAVAEGSVIPTHNVLTTIESTDPEFFWVVGWVETALLRAIWYPTSVCTLSWHVKQTIKKFLEKTSDDPEAELPFKLHDFGQRGVSSGESAMVGGTGHLVNFMGSDTVEGIWCANKYYNSKMSAYSIPAAEHSTITSWGKYGEVNAYRNILKQFAKPGKIVAVVSDSYDIFNAVENIWCGELLQEVKDSQATVVIRPDSGNPIEVVLKILQIMDRKLEMTLNSKGYKVLPNYFRIIQGDGMDEQSIFDLFDSLEKHGYSASNIAVGMGGGLLQKDLNRDTLKFAMKCSSVTINGKNVEVYKEPITDFVKKSKKGKLDLVIENGQYKTVNGENSSNSVLKTVFENGKLITEYTLEEVRINSVYEPKNS